MGDFFIAAAFNVYVLNSLYYHWEMKTKKYVCSDDGADYKFQCHKAYYTMFLKPQEHYLPQTDIIFFCHFSFGKQYNEANQLKICGNTLFARWFHLTKNSIMWKSQHYGIFHTSTHMGAIISIWKPHWTPWKAMKKAKTVK